jgi:hypothetical protein
MIKFENFETFGWDHAIRGMRNPMNSWNKSDSDWASVPIEKYRTVMYNDDHEYLIGPNDQALMIKLVKGGSVHAKFRRMITVYVDITAPLYWWKEFDTYKVGTVANSCSTMHKIQAKEFELDDFSHEHLVGFESHLDWSDSPFQGNTRWDSANLLRLVIDGLNYYRKQFLKTKDKKYWWQMIQLLPSSYNQKRTVMLNYEVLAGIYPMRKEHKLDEWRCLCKWIEELPFYEIITGEVD